MISAINYCDAISLSRRLDRYPAKTVHEEDEEARLLRHEKQSQHPEQVAAPDWKKCFKMETFAVVFGKGRIVSIKFQNLLLKQRQREQR